MQLLNLTKCGLFFNIVSPVVHTLLPLVLQRLDSCGTCIEAVILILEKFLNCRHDLIISLILLPCQVFFHDVGEQKTVRWCQVRRIWRVINQFKATVMHSSHCNLRLVCRSIVMVKQDSFHQFSRLFWNVSSTTFQSPQLLMQCAFIWKETMQLVSGKFEFNACQVSLLLAQLLLSQPMNFSVHPHKG